MEDVCNELDLVKDELKKLKTEYQIQTELFNNLKNAHTKQSLRVEETQQTIEKQSEELKVKCEEIVEARKLVEELESRLQVKELSLRDLSSCSEKLKADFEQKVRSLEVENRELVSTSNELIIRNKDLEKELCAHGQQIEGLKSQLLITETKYCEAERMAQEGKEYKRRDVAISALEDEKENFRDQLKWKEEQFKHLEEAHDKLQDQFRMSEENWERERSALVEEICSLQTQLDSQTRAAEDFRARLEMCNGALAREESKRRSLEVHVSDMESRFHNSSAQFEGETSEIHVLSDQINEEIAKLRNLLGTKEMVLKEGETKIMCLEQENLVLRESLKEFQDAQIRNAGTTSYLKLQNQLRRLEKAHSTCSLKLKEKESELLSEIESIRKFSFSCKSELEDKDEKVKKLHQELEICHCEIQVSSIEISMMLEVLKSELSEAYSATYNVKLEMELHNQEKDDKIFLLAAQLEMKCEGLERARLELNEEHEQVLNLTESLKSLELMKQQLLIAHEEPEHRRNLLGESVGSQLCSKNHAVMESVITVGRQDLQCGDVLLSAISSKASRPKCNPQDDETSEIFHNERENFYFVLQEKDSKIEDILQQVELLEDILAAKVNEMEAFLQENKILTQIAKENDICIGNLKSEMAKLKQEFRRREVEITTVARSEMAKEFTEEKEVLLRVITEKEQRVKNLMVLAMSLERDLTSAFASSFEDVVEKQVKIDALTKALKEGKYVSDLEIKEKTKLIADLENEVSALRERLTHQERSFLSVKLEAEYLQVLMKCGALETEKNILDRQRRADGILKKLESDKQALLQENTKLCSERQSLVGYIEEVCDKIGDFSSEDAKMMKALRKMLSWTEDKNEVENMFYGSLGGKSDASFSITKHKNEASTNERSPLKEVNM